MLSALRRSIRRVRNCELRTARVLPLALLAMGPLSPGPALAFSDPASSYDLPVFEGGGGGRWFTGTPRDGFGCDVCHSNPGTVPLTVTGLPLDTGYTPGQAYEVGMQWPPQVEHLALVLEMVDDAGATAGTLAVPVPEAARAPEQCSKEGAEGIPASSIVESESGRQFAAVVDCGSQSMRMLWTAPPAAAGTVWLSGGFVWSDDDASAAGDVSVKIRTPIPPLGAPAPVQALTQSGCNVTGLHTGSVWPALFAMMGLCARRRRRGGTP